MGRVTTPDPLDRRELTRSQRAIWTGQRLHPEAPLYNMAFSFEIEGEVDAGRLQRAFTRLVAGHESLRTVLEVEGETPYQRLDPDVDDTVEIFDLSDEVHPDRAARLAVQQRCERPFAVDSRLFDAALYRLSPQTSVLYFGQHHVVSDAWSAALLFRRWSELYLNDQPVAEVRPDYSRYLEHERKRRDNEAARAHWNRYAESDLSPPRLYGGRRRPSSTASTRVALDLGASRSEALGRLACSPEAGALTPELGLFNLLATLVVAYQWRVSNQSELAVGALSHGRPTPDLQQTAGLLTELFPLAVEVGEARTFRQLLESVRGEALSFLKFAVAGAGDARYNRGLNVVLNSIRGSIGDFAGMPVHSEWLHPGHHDREHALRVHSHDFNATGRLHLLFDFNDELFDERRRHDAVGHFTRLVDAFVADWEQPIPRVDLLAPEEIDRQLTELSGGPPVAGEQTTVVDLFARQVERDPKAIAVVCGEVSLSYADLAARVERLAVRLASRHTSPVVALLMRRSCDAVVATLATLRAGGSFVPIDPQYPAKRIVGLLSDCGASVVVTERRSIDAIPQEFSGTVFVVDRPEDEADRLPDDPKAETLFDPDSTAYVLYTSGSTGRPKGVAVPHSALANYVSWADANYCDGRRLAFPLFTPLTFDLTLTSLFVPLVSGGSIVVYPESDAGPDLALLEVLEEDAVDVVKLTPSHMALLREREPRPSRVGQLIFGGEPLTADLAGRAVELFGGSIAVHNEYGPTEATVGCIVHTYDPARDRSGTVPIGRPIAGMRAFVLDRQLRPVPEGVVGELFVSGAGLAHSYLNLPEETAERFVESTLGPERLYATGDLGRVQAPGVLEHLGRRDDQVKLRGARIELAEVEAAVASHPEIEQCVARLEPAHAAMADDPERYCSRCALPSNYPGVHFDGEGVCSQCRAFDEYREKAEGYFRSPDELRATLDASRSTDAPYDCIALLSGGKDSTYMLCRLVDMGYRVLAFTLDNGFISDQAKGNIRRVVSALEVDHHFATTPAMDAIFVDSLERHSNVCHGCFKTIYTLSMQLARELGVPFVVTGLSRGQFFETRLTEELFTDPQIAEQEVDDFVLEARKAYHRVDDAVRRNLDVELFADDRIFEEVRIVDFYRYVDVGLDELMVYLDERVPWVRPSDTGRSTNCRINDVGIWVHKRERGFHNYALPYSWDVRIGHKDRDAALEELQDEIDPREVARILDQLGYQGASPASSGERLAAYYLADREVSPAELRRHVAGEIPGFMIPSRFYRVDEIPRTAHGKADRAALTPPSEAETRRETMFSPPRSGLETAIARIWQDVLGVDRVGVRDDFFELGGDSILAIQIVARCHREGLQVTPVQLFEALTVERLAKLVVAGGAPETTAAPRGPVVLSPGQRWFLEGGAVGRWSQRLTVTTRSAPDPDRLERALAAVVGHHDALRTAFVEDGDRWRAEIVGDQALDVAELLCLTPARDGAEATFELARPPLLRAALATENGGARLTLVAHHLAVDAVSWSILLDDLESAYRQLALGSEVRLAPATGAGVWTASLADAATASTDTDLELWRRIVGTPHRTPPVDFEGVRPNAASTTETVRVALDPARTAVLVDRLPKRRLPPHELLLAALVSTVNRWSGGGATGLFLEGHGREQIARAPDPSRTVGWLSTLFPIVFDLSDEAPPEEVLRTVRQQMRELPHNGLAYGLMRYLAGAEGLSPESSRFPVLFNYLGQSARLAPAGSMFQVARPLELLRDGGRPRPFPIEVHASVDRDRLLLDWEYSRERHRLETIEEQAARMLTETERLIDASLAAAEIEAGDFPLANLDAAKLAKLSAALRRDGD